MNDESNIQSRELKIAILKDTLNNISAKFQNQIVAIIDNEYSILIPSEYILIRDVLVQNIELIERGFLDETNDWFVKGGK